MQYCHLVGIANKYNVGTSGMPDYNNYNIIECNCRLAYVESKPDDKHLQRINTSSGMLT